MAKSSSNSIPSPKGTRDLYPDDLLRQRYITEAWRRVSIRHGFEEIAGPTFEMLDLYKKKSGEGIVSELFSFTRAGGDDDYALRPEFTPTLARMYAAKANALPSPCKWFTAGPYFRAEKPQRGRLREFLQWNCDVIGGDQESASLHDAEIIAVILDLTTEFGLVRGHQVCMYLNDRRVVAKRLESAGVSPNKIDVGFNLLDSIGKIDLEEFKKRSSDLGIVGEALDRWVGFAGQRHRMVDVTLNADPFHPQQWGLAELTALHSALLLSGQLDGCGYLPSLARGLAYYTGTVFELIADGERAVAGGGRYDNLIELFGGPPTPAVGFGMGDVVLGLLLEDMGLMPEGPALMDALSQKPASLRPEAFVIGVGAHERHIESLLAQLRRGIESQVWKDREGKPWDADRYDVAPLHARRSYKSKKNIGKVIDEARKQHAKFAVIIESDEAAKVENLDTREDLGTFPLDQVGAKIAERL